MDEKIYVGLIGATELRDTLESTGVIECITGSVAQVTKEIRVLNKENGGTIPVFVEDPEESDSGLQRWCEVFPSKTGTPVVIIRQGDVATLRNDTLTEVSAPISVNALLEAAGLTSFESLEDKTFPTGAFVGTVEPASDEDDELDQLERDLAESEAEATADEVNTPTQEASEDGQSDHERSRGRRASGYEAEPELEASSMPFHQEQFEADREFAGVEGEDDQQADGQYPDSFQGMQPTPEYQSPEFPAGDAYSAPQVRRRDNRNQMGYQDRADYPQANSSPNQHDDRYSQWQPQDYTRGQYPQGGFENQPVDQYGQQGVTQPPYGQQQWYGQNSTPGGYQPGQQYGYERPPYGQVATYQDQRDVDHYGRQKLGQAVIIFASKGGVGKSSVAIDLAHEAGKSGRKVILIDANSGQPDLMVMLGLERSGLPTIHDAALSDDVGVCLLTPDQINHYRPHDADEVTFGFVAAPLSRTNRRGDVTNYFYAQVIEEARRRADLVIVDTQILENDDKTGIVEEVFVPVLDTASGWGIGVTECSAVSVNSLEERLRDLTGTWGIAASKFMTLFNRVDVDDMEDVVKERAEAFRGFGEVLGAIPESRTAKLAIDNRKLELGTPLFSKRIVAALMRLDRTEELLNRDREIEAIMAGPEKKPNFWMRLFMPKPKNNA